MKTMNNWMKGMAFAAMMVMSMGATAQGNKGNLVVTEHGISYSGNTADTRSNAYQDSRYDNYGTDSRYDSRYDNYGNGSRYDDRYDNYGNGSRYDDRYDNYGNGSRYDNYGTSRYDRGPAVVHEGRGHAYNPYEGRVRHMADGRWGYLRDNLWYYYDCYYEPAYYFARPLRHFHSHRVGKTVAAVTTGVVIGSIITSLMAR